MALESYVTDERLIAVCGGGMKESREWSLALKAGGTNGPRGCAALDSKQHADHIR